MILCKFLINRSDHRNIYSLQAKLYKFQYINGMITSKDIILDIVSSKPSKTITLPMNNKSFTILGKPSVHNIDFKTYKLNL